MDAILKRMEAKAAKVHMEEAQTAPHPEILRARQEEMKRRQELVQYRERASRHLKKLMQGRCGATLMAFRSSLFFVVLTFWNDC